MLLGKTEILFRIGQCKEDHHQMIDESSPQDLWFHLEDHPSPHVFLKTNNTTKNKISKNVIKACAFYCKQYSKLKSSNNVSIIYTEIKNVEKTDKIGCVITRNTKTISC